MSRPHRICFFESTTVDSNILVLVAELLELLVLHSLDVIIDGDGTTKLEFLLL